MEISNYTDQLIKEYSKKMEEFIKYKIGMLQRKAEESGDIFLASLLYRLRADINVEEIAKELERYGYSLEIEQPPPRYDFNNNADIYMVKAIIDVDKVKVRVKKLIAEV